MDSDEEFEEYNEYNEEILDENPDDDNNSSSSDDSSDENSNSSSELSDNSDDDISDINSDLSDIDFQEKLPQSNKKKAIKQQQYIGCEYLTKFEKVRVLSTRSEQISQGAKIFVNTDKTDPLEIALEELYAGKMPLIIRRYFGNNSVDISVNSLLII